MHNSTSQVLGALASGIFPQQSKQTLVAAIQSADYDSLEPTYSCPAANALRDAYEGSNFNWQAHLTAAAPLWSRLDAVSGISNPDNGGWHTSIDHYFDNLSSKLCHQKALPCSVNSTSTCVSEADAEAVFRLGSECRLAQLRSEPD